MGMLEHVHRHLGHAAELAGERPFGAGAVAQDAAEHLHLGSRDAGRLGRAGDLLDLGLAIDREEAHAELEGARDVALLLDRVAEGDAVGRRAGVERQLDLDDGGRVEARAELGQELEHLRLRVGLHGVEHARVGERPGELGVVVAHDVEVDDQAGPSSRRLRRNSRMRSVMALSPPKVQWRSCAASGLKFRRQECRPASAREDGIPLRAMETREAAMGSSPDDAALDWIGECSDPHAWQ